MIKTTIVHTVFVCTALVCTMLSARVSAENIIVTKKDSSLTGKSAGCLPGVSVAEMAFNNVRTYLDVPGTMWLDRALGKGAYYIPANSGSSNEPSSIFAGGIWIGGLDPAGNLKLAAVRFRQVGNDFWPGPLTTDGSATISQAVCTQYDKHFYIARSMVELHLLYFQRIHYDQINGTTTSTQEPFEDGYVIPNEILNWPAHGNVSLGQDFYLAPFADNPFGTGTEGLYEPELGDYPRYQFNVSESDCKNKTRNSPAALYGDETFWWVFNDAGNIHTESQGTPIGVEIRAQAFAFSTLDELNNMTFYNYSFINRSNVTLSSTYVSQWANPQIGGPDDDYFGCDVQRGMGYSYNGDNNDLSQGESVGYGIQPPAIGFDFMEGPFIDDDGMDNPGPDNYQDYLSYAEVTASNGVPYASLGSGFGDGVVDNERFGATSMLHFFSNAPVATIDPQIDIHYYRNMQGIWRDGTPLTYGGTGYAPNNPNAIPAKYYYSRNSDPAHWSTQGVDPGYEWSEESMGNPAGNRRFVQSAGPFTLLPGEQNNMTIGVVWARAATGGPLASVEALLYANDKAQILFDNCFRTFDGPDAPDLSVQELDREIIIYLRNSSLSNNQNETFAAFDYSIPAFTNVLDTLGLPSGQVIENDQYYRFQGYQIYQIRHAEVDLSQLNNPQVSRLAFQVDIKDGVTNLINYTLDPVMGIPVPTLMVNGANDGVRHSFRVTRDLFALDDDRLINFKKYHFVAIAYAANQYADYNSADGSGQTTQYLSGRKGASGAVKPVTAIPHIPAPENYGTSIGAVYGQGFEITRIEGTGNGGLEVALTNESIAQIMSGEPWKADKITYQRGKGPVNIKVVDPLNLKAGDYRLRLYNDVIGETPGGQPIYQSVIDSAKWSLEHKSTEEIVYSSRTIDYQFEQLIPEFGISIDIEQYRYNFFGRVGETRAELLSWSINFQDPAKAWLFGVEDTDDFTLQNWIMSGRINEQRDDSIYAGAPCFRMLDATGNEMTEGPISPHVFNDLAFQTDDENFPIDGDKMYDAIFGGTIAPYRLVRPYDCGPAPLSGAIKEPEGSSPSRKAMLSDLESIDIVYTPNRDLWTRVPVLEMQHDPQLAENGGIKMFTRKRPSVDKFGNPVAAGVTAPSTNPNDANFMSATGMGWFPGYAINVETGERLNMAFGEDSFQAVDNGRDMIWNPSSRVYSQPSFTEVFGGQHYVYIFRNNRVSAETNNSMPSYDYGKYLMEKLEVTSPLIEYRRFWKDCMYVQSPLAFGLLPLAEGLIPTETTLSIRVAKPYQKYATLASLGNLNYSELGSVLNPLNVNLLQQSENDWYPMYDFSISSDISTATNQLNVAKVALAQINIVPNPYYAFSEYETGPSDYRVKFTNLPPECTIRVYSINGTLLKTFRKNDPLTFLDWDMSNDADRRLASGMYLIHVNVPEVGERILKWFAVTRKSETAGP
jgi:hypothetical protein